MINEQTGEMELTEEQLEEWAEMGQFHAERIANELNKLPWAYDLNPWDWMFDFDEPHVVGDMPDNFFSWGLNTDPNSVPIEALTEANDIIVLMLEKAGYLVNTGDPRIASMARDQITFMVNAELDI